MKKKTDLEVNLLKTILALYVIMAFVLAGLNFGYANQASDQVAALIKTFWHFYENELKTIFIVLGGYLTLRIARKSGRIKLRKNNLFGFFLVALVVHIIGPYLLNYPDLYYFAMPLPWTNQPLQLLVPGSNFYLSFLSLQGERALKTVLFFYFSFSAVVFIGTIIRGRRWQCSTLCLFSGFVSEVFAPVFPLIGKKKKAGPGLIKLFRVLRWLFFSIALFFSGFWLLQAAGLDLPGNLTLFAQIEIYKYLFFDLIAALLLWSLFTGRGYCFYCPLGTAVGLIGQATGQRIETNLTQCINCGKCNQACPMSIDIASCAREGKPVINLNCVGCGHCVDSCPKETLSYVTRLCQTL
jgi:ferredoxin-type protein NapH